MRIAAAAHPDFLGVDSGCPRPKKFLLLRPLSLLYLPLPQRPPAPKSAHLSFHLPAVWSRYATKRILVSYKTGSSYKVQLQNVKMASNPYCNLDTIFVFAMIAEER
ncbi:hypothetical protein M9H77_21407 [Catharanthus roseus]|uniref:Uncharacterized protein n=1 Tax=Catharanthus roseus TaxID=4058 RepID=A0ACC0APJ8_CATRO|nr:hypothetical protein M9H77_21407 [Catharanthus roseus]